MIEDLFRKLNEIEQRNGFAGMPYPPGIVPFPKRLIGQGFFPGGDGLWRDDTYEGLRSPSPYPFPKFGVMFLGNDFGSLKGFSRLGIHENPPTWRHLRRRIALGDLQGKNGFFTNAYLGLRTDRGALDEGVFNMEFDNTCREFLEFQILTQAPRLIVVLGDRANNLLNQVIKMEHLSTGTPLRAEFQGFTTTVVQVSHPYSDLNKTEAGLAKEGSILKIAWGRSF